MSPFLPAYSGLPASLWWVMAALLVLAVGMSLFWAFGVWRWAGRNVHNTGAVPRLSVIVAGRNEARYIADCLQALVNLVYEADHLEIIFVDDHSSDQTRAIAEAIAAEHSDMLTILSAPPCPPGVGPKKNAIAFGVAHAKGEILAFTDADCLVKSAWAKCITTNYDEGTGAVTGPVLPPLQPGLANLFLRLERIFVSYSSVSAIGWGHPASASGGNFSYRRKAFDQLGGMAMSNVASGDDDLMAQAIARLGWKVGYASGADAVVEHVRQPTWRQEVNATVRHQSTARYYPLGWRIAYALSILSNIGILALAVSSLFRTELLPLFGAAFALRLIAEGLAVQIFCRRYDVSLNLFEFLVAEICLPAYLLTRAVLSLFPSFSWHARTHQSAAPSADAS
jgi:cellulose synthase/poly-beta-1,6-N-acetylglucosamine synthase-like glycosyltransferase